MARIIWTREALANLELIRRYIAQFDPTAARRVAKRLVDAADSLQEYPDRGRTGRGDYRELTTIAPYLLRYRVDGERVYIVGVRHGARQPD